MTFKPHKDYKTLTEIWPEIEKYQALATAHGIADIFQDNGGKLLQVLLLLGLQILPGREGNDAKDSSGIEYEMKSVNINLTKGFSTHHHMNPIIMAKYKQVPWVFAVYKDIELVAVFYLDKDGLNPYYDSWHKKWVGMNPDIDLDAYMAAVKQGIKPAQTTRDINNPKIPLAFIRQNAKRVFIKPGEELNKLLLVPVERATTVPDAGGFEPEGDE